MSFIKFFRDRHQDEYLSSVLAALGVIFFLGCIFVLVYLMVYLADINSWLMLLPFAGVLIIRCLADVYDDWMIYKRNKDNENELL